MELTKAERRERKKKKRMPMHGKSLEHLANAIDKGRKRASKKGRKTLGDSFKSA